MEEIRAEAAMVLRPPRRFLDLPGPPMWPVFGNAFSIEATSAHQRFSQWAERYGPYYRVRIGPRRLLVISDHAVIASVLRDRPQRFRRPTNHGNIVREMGFEQGLFFANDEVWKRQRRMVMAALDPGHVKAFLPMLLTVAERLRGRWQKAARAGAEIDLQADLMRYTVDVIAGLAFGTDVNTLESDADVIQRHLNRIFPALGRRVIAPFAYWRYLKLPADRALDRSVREVKAAIERFIAAARQKMREEPERRAQPTNLLEAMIAAADASGEPAADGDVAGNVFIMLVAGEDTTANTLAWLFDFLHRHPEAMARARAEVEQAAPDPARLTLHDVSQMRYVDACIQETLRLKPVAPLLPSQAVADTVVGDVAVPAGTFVIGLMRHDSLDARHFAAPLAFDPGRWLDEGAGDARSPVRVSMPFGAGARLCPGRYLSLVEMKIAIVTLLGNFEIVRVGTRDGRPARELLNFAMAPVGLRMTLAPGRASPERAATASAA
jgi:cytochrome P450